MATAMCHRCGKKVYFAEGIDVIGKRWHKHCVKCVNCNDSVAPGRVVEKNNDIYCKACYDSLFRDGGYGNRGAYDTRNARRAVQGGGASSGSSSSGSSNFCAKCGKEASGAFCSNCGEKIGGAGRSGGSAPKSSGGSVSKTSGQSYSGQTKKSSASRSSPSSSGASRQYPAGGERETSSGALSLRKTGAGKGVTVDIAETYEPTSGRPDAVKGGLAKTTYEKPPSWAFAEANRPRHTDGKNTQEKKLW